jgi:hypothetical protein
MSTVKLDMKRDVSRSGGGAEVSSYPLPICKIMRRVWWVRDRYYYWKKKPGLLLRPVKIKF